MGQLALRTGGVLFQAADANGLCEAMTRIGTALNNQYVLGYYPPEGAPAGKYRRIRVELRVPEGTPALRIYPHLYSAANLIGGSQYNTITAGLAGATLGGGGVGHGPPGLLRGWGQASRP
jgi:hypothetical protein